MAGAIPINPTRAQFALIQRLRPYHLGVFLMTLDEHGWQAAQELLRGYAGRDEYHQTEKPEVTP
jgi:hypothetical protein